MKQLLNSIVVLVILNFSNCSLKSQNSDNPYQININFITSLDSQLNENSGIAFYHGNLVTLNDGQNSNQLFIFDSINGSIIKKLEIKNAINNDWEELTVNQNGHIFIGDFGNNKGDRKNLSIIRLIQDSINRSDTLLAEYINFSYPSQIDFVPRKEHSFNCEAMISLNNHLYIFTKNKPEANTDLYKLPVIPGKYEAKKLATFNSEGLITGAAINSNHRRIALVGYNKKDDVFLWLLEDFKDENLFSGKNFKFNLGDFNEFGQAESVVFIDNETVYISTEKTKDMPPKLYKIKIVKK